MKKFAAILLVLVMALLAVPAFASDGITPEEQAVLDHFAEGRVIEGKLVTPFPKHITVATNSLIERAYTAEELQRVTEVIDACYDILEAEKITNYEDMKNSPRLQEIVDMCNELAKSLGYSFYFNFENGDVVIKQTGFNMTATFIIIGVLVAIAAAAVIIVSKRKLVVKA